MGVQDTEGDLETIEIKKGSLVVIHGSVVHASTANKSSGSRWVYTFHACSGGAVWDDGNWLQPSPGGFDKLASL